MKQRLIPVGHEERLPGRWTPPRTLAIDDADVSPAAPADLSTALKKAGIPPSRSTRMNSKILFRRDRTIRHPEGYELKIGKDRILFRFSGDAGAFYAVQTFAEILQAEGPAPACRLIRDQPLFRRRGVSLDCSRGKVPKPETLRSLIRLLASWKINELQLYIENTFRFPSHPAIGRGFDPFTAEEIRDLADFCAERFIRLVPSLASFGHMEKILMLKPYRTLAEKPGFNALAGGTTLNPLHPGSIRLMEDLYADFLPCFRTGDFNICGDEPWELGKGASKSTAEKKGTGQVYLDFILKLRGLCRTRGFRANMWADIVLNHPEIIPKIPKDIVMLNWDYDPASAAGRMNRHMELARAGLAALCCTGTNGWSSHGSRLSDALRNVADFSAIGLKHRAAGILHTDWGDAGHRNTLAVSLASMAHAAGHAWNTTRMDDEGHLERFAFHLFGDRTGRLARHLRVLGEKDSGSWAYYSLVESLKTGKQFRHFFGMGWPQMGMQKFSGERIARRIAALKSLDFSSFPVQTPFTGQLLEQFGLAVFMDRLAWERLALSRRLKTGQPLSAKLLRKHREDYRALKKRFARIWLKTNRPSRLQDNLDAFDAAIRELSGL